jgi:hypothetical protein
MDGGTLGVAPEKQCTTDGIMVLSLKRSWRVMATVHVILNVLLRLCKTHASNPSYNLKRDSNINCGVKTTNQENWSYYGMLNWKLMLHQKTRPMTVIWDHTRYSAGIEEVHIFFKNWTEAF